MAYAAQDPWMMDGTVRDSVCMGLPHGQDFYDKVMEACALEEDLQQWSNGDLTWVGDRGVQCSGGQRALNYSSSCFLSSVFSVSVFDFEF
jgi:ATP-binding cassette, subfamily C (CFTR/MRP), member 4